MKILTIIALLLTLISCKQNNPIYSFSPQEISFFGDSAITIHSTNKPNGYSVSIFKSPRLTLYNFKRGDSINKFIALDWLPEPIHASTRDSFGTYFLNIDIPVVKDLGGDIFFMDINFDGEEELLVHDTNYSKIYYSCYDLVNGDPKSTGMILLPNSIDPYGNYFNPECIFYPNPDFGGKADFDYSNKTIHIIEDLYGMMGSEYLCKVISDGWFKPQLKVVSRENYNKFNPEGNIHKYTYKYIDDELKLTSDTIFSNTDIR